MDDARYVLSFGGGVNSAAAMVVLLRERAPIDEAIFADTGGETPGTYKFVRLAEQWLAERGVPLIRVQKPGRNLYETAWERSVIPSAVWRWSTRDYKITPILRHYRKLGKHIRQYLAIAFDEIERMKDSRVSYVTNLYPLIERRMTRADCERVILEEGLPVPERSACYFCPFNSVDRWRWLSTTYPDLYDKAVALEEHSKHFPSQRLTDQAFRPKGKITLRELRQTFLSSAPLRALPVIQMNPCGAECHT